MRENEGKLVETFNKNIKETSLKHTENVSGDYDVHDKQRVAVANTPCRYPLHSLQMKDEGCC